MSTRQFSDEQEKHIAKITGGEVQSNSGGTKFGGGDVHTKEFLIEAKTPTKIQDSFSVKYKWLIKMQEQAFEQGKSKSALAIRFAPCGKDYYIITEEEFLEYMEYIESLEK